MGHYTADLPNLVIPNAGTTSGAIGGFSDADVVVIYAPSALTGVITIQVEPTDTGTNWADLGSGGADVTIGAGNSVTINPIGFRQIRLSSTLAEGAARTFTVTKGFTVNR